MTPARPRPPIRLRPLLVLAALCALLPHAWAAAAIERHDGQAFDPGSGQLLYRETHWRYERDGAPARLVLYRCPDGAAFARKQLRYGRVPMAPDFDFVDARDGYREGVRTLGSGREVYWQASGQAPVQRRPLPPSSPVVDAGFDELVRQRWPALAGGGAVPANFLLPSRAGLLAMVLRRDTAAPATPGDVRLVMSMDAWYGFAAPKLRLTYRGDEPWLLRFEGIGTIRDDRGRHRAVRIEFPPGQRRRGATPESLQADQSEPLSGRCTA